MRRPCRLDAHGKFVACDQMGLDTDGRGFPHRQVLAGRVATRHCQSCHALCVKDAARGLRLAACAGEKTREYPVVRWQSVLGVFVSPLCPACYERKTGSS